MHFSRLLYKQFYIQLSTLIYTFIMNKVFYYELTDQRFQRTKKTLIAILILLKRV